MSVSQSVSSIYQLYLGTRDDCVSPQMFAITLNQKEQRGSHEVPVKSRITSLSESHEIYICSQKFHHQSMTIARVEWLKTMYVLREGKERRIDKKQPFLRHSFY